MLSNRMRAGSEAIGGSGERAAPETVEKGSVMLTEGGDAGDAGVTAFFDVVSSASDSGVDGM